MENNCFVFEEYAQVPRFQFLSVQPRPPKYAVSPVMVVYGNAAQVFPSQCHSSFPRHTTLINFTQFAQKLHKKS